MAISVVNRWDAEFTLAYSSANVATASSTGNWLVVVAGWNPDGSGINPAITVADNARNYWIPATISATSGLTRTAVWVAPNARATTLVSVSPTIRADAFTAVVIEVSGMPLYASIDAVASTTFTGVTTVSLPITATAADVVFAGACIDSIAPTITVSGTFTASNGAAIDSGLPNGAAYVKPAWQTTSGAGTVTATWNFTAAAEGSAVAIAVKQTAPAPSQPNPNWPAIQDQMAFGYQPGDPTALPVWTDITGKLIELSCKRGRQYELDQLQAGTATLKLRNNTGDFDPTNGASPYAPNVIPYVPFRRLATWNGSTYPVITGYVERWPQEWSETRYGVSPATAVDTLAPLAAITLPSPITSEILHDGPYGYWPLNDPAGATAAGNLSGRTQTVLATRASQTGTTGTSSGFGATLDLPGDTGSGWQMQGQVAATSGQGYSLFVNDRTMPQPSTGFGVEFYMMVPAASSGTVNEPVLLTYASAGSSTSFLPAFEIVMTGTSFDHLTVQALSYSAADSATYSGVSLVDNAFHHVFAWVTSTTVTVWLDGAQVLTHTWTLTLPDGLQLLTLNGIATATAWFAGWNGSYAHLAIHDKKPTTDRIAAHANAGLTGFTGETTGARAQRILRYGAWTQARLIDAGDSTMQACAHIMGKSAPEALGDVNDTEVGLTAVDAAGTAYIRSRTTGYNRAAQWTLGDGPGETPYLGDVAFDYDPTFVDNAITVTRNQGGQGYAADTTSQRKYFTRNLPRTTYADNDNDAVDQANWLLGRYKDPHLRVSEVTLDPASNMAVWPVALGIDVGDVVTVTRRPTYAPALSGTFVVQQVAPDIGPGRWKVKLTLAPVDPRVLTLDDPTYGALGTYPLAW